MALIFWLALGLFVLGVAGQGITSIYGCLTGTDSPTIVGGTDSFVKISAPTITGDTSNLTINAKSDGTAGNASLGLTGDSIYLGSSTPHGGNASAALGFGAAAGLTTGFTLGTDSVTTRVQSGSTFTGNLGSEAYTVSDLVFQLKSKGILKV